MKKILATVLATALLSSAAHAAETGTMRLFRSGSAFGPSTLRVTVVDDLQVKIQQCDVDGAQCGQASIYKRAKKADKMFTLKYPGQEKPSSAVMFMKENHIIFENQMPSFMDTSVVDSVHVNYFYK